MEVKDQFVLVSDQVLDQPMEPTSENKQLPVISTSDIPKIQDSDQKQDQNQEQKQLLPTILNACWQNAYTRLANSIAQQKRDALDDVIVNLGVESRALERDYITGKETIKTQIRELEAKVTQLTTAHEEKIQQFNYQIAHYRQTLETMPFFPAKVFQTPEEKKETLTLWKSNLIVAMNQSLARLKPGQKIFFKSMKNDKDKIYYWNLASIKMVTLNDVKGSRGTMQVWNIAEQEFQLISWYNIFNLDITTPGERWMFVPLNLPDFADWKNRENLPFQSLVQVYELLAQLHDETWIFSDYPSM